MTNQKFKGLLTWLKLMAQHAYMTSADLIEEVRIEMDNIEVVLKELADLYKDVKGKDIILRLSPIS
jgi:hypothetical protein